MRKATFAAMAAMVLLAPGLAAAAPNTGGSASTHDCLGVAQSCGDWKANGANTCRTCQQAQCKTENGKDVLAGNKTTTQCYSGHGSPPADNKTNPKTPRPEKLAPKTKMQ